MSNTRPVPIRGVHYPSMMEAARVLGVSVSSISEARRQGRLERVGLRPMKQLSLMQWLANASPEDFPRLKQEAQKWFAFHHPRKTK